MLIIADKIDSKKAEAKRKLGEATTCRAQADSAALRGSASRSLGQPHGSLLEQAKSKIYEACNLEQEALGLESEVIHILIFGNCQKQ